MVTYRELPEYPGYRFGSDGLPQRWTGRKWVDIYVRYDGPTPKIRISVNGDRIVRSLPALILKAFVGPRPIGCQAMRFPDENPRNNSVENLRWAPIGASKVGKPFAGRPPKNPLGPRKITEDQAKEILALSGDDFTLTEIAAKFGLSESHVAKIIMGRCWRDLPGREALPTSASKTRGERNAHAKLTRRTICAAVRMRSEGKTLAEIGAALGVGKGTVSRVLKGRTYEGLAVKYQQKMLATTPRP